MNKERAVFLFTIILLVMLVCCFVTAEEETGINTTRFRGLYGKNYVGKLESTATIPTTTGVSYLTKNGLLLNGPYICDGKTGKVMRDLSIEILHGDIGFMYYYNGNNDLYYIVSYHHIYIYSLTANEFVCRLMCDLFVGRDYDRLLLYCDDTYIYASCVRANDKGDYVLIRYDIKKDVSEEVDLTEISQSAKLYYQPCYEPCFIIFETMTEECWLLDWSTEDRILKKLDSSYRNACYINNKQIVAWTKIKDEDCAVCFSIDEQEKILWQLPKEYKDCQMNNKYECIFSREDNGFISVGVADGKIAGQSDRSWRFFGLAWCRDYVIVVKSNVNVLNLRSLEMLFSVTSHFDWYLAFDNSRETICLTLYDSIIVYSLKEEKEVFRVKYVEIFEDYEKIYWSNTLNAFILLQEKGKQWVINVISKDGMVKKCEGNDSFEMYKQIIQLGSEGHTRDIACELIEGEKEIYVHINDGIIYIENKEHNEVCIVKDGVVNRYECVDDWHVVDYIDEKYSIIYDKKKKGTYLYSYRTRNKCRLDECRGVFGGNILLSGYNIFTYDIYNRKYRITRNMSCISVWAMCPGELVFAEQVENKCFLILRSVQCEYDEQAKRITEFLENEDKIHEAIDK